MRKLQRLALGAIGTLLVASPLLAHHAWPVDRSKEVTVKGTVTAYTWADPHVMIALDVVVADGRTEKWDVGGPSLSRMSGNGWDRNTLKPGDVITGVNGQRIFNTAALVDEIEKNPNAELTLDLRRGGEPLQFKVRPALIESEGVTKPRIGIQWDGGGRLSLSHPDPVEQVYHSITSTLQTLGAVASPSSDVKLQHMSGPIMIVRIYYMLFESENGWKLALWFSVILNVNLAILNMLPIPVLDGGHIVLAIIESVRRKPVNMRILEWVQTACATLIIGYMLYITFFDIGDLLGKNSDQKSSRKESPTTNASPATSDP